MQCAFGVLIIHSHISVHDDTHTTNACLPLWVHAQNWRADWTDVPAPMMMWIHNVCSTNSNATQTFYKYCVLGACHESLTKYMYRTQRHRTWSVKHVRRHQSDINQRIVDNVQHQSNSISNAVYGPACAVCDAIWYTLPCTFSHTISKFDMDRKYYTRRLAQTQQMPMCPIQTTPYTVPKNARSTHKRSGCRVNMCRAGGNRAASKRICKIFWMVQHVVVVGQMRRRRRLHIGFDYCQPPMTTTTVVV